MKMHYMMILLPLVYLAGNGYVFWRLLPLLSGLPAWGKVTCSIAFWLVAFMLVAMILLRDVAFPQWLGRTLFAVGSTWMVAVLYMVMFLIVADIVKLFIPLFNHGFVCALCATIVLLIYGCINYLNPLIERLDIKLDKPMKCDSVKIVAVSDIHLGLGTGKDAARRYVEMINAERPDVVVIAGDLIDNNVAPVVANHLEEELNAIKAPMGVYLVPGNHEYISGIEECDQFLKKTQIKFLKDSVVELPCGVQIVGRDDRMNKRRKPVAHIMEQADRSKPIVMLDHQPYEVAKKDSLGVDVQISGHTHRGQVWPLSVLVDNMYEQSHGYRKWPHSHVYVSSGLSLWGPPFRIGTNSDMAVITLRR